MTSPARNAIRPGRRSSTTWPSWPHEPTSSCSACPTAWHPRVAREIVAAPQRRVGVVVDTSTIGVAAARELDGLLDDAGVSYVDAPVSGGVAGATARTLLVLYAGPGRDLPHRRACAGRLERPATPGRRPARHGAGAEAGQQLPVCDSARRHQRGHRVRPLGGSRHGDHAGGHRRVERAERGHQRQVPQPRGDRSLRRRIRQLAHGQGPAALPERRPGARGTVGAGVGDRVGLGALCRRRAGGRLHPDLPVRGPTKGGGRTSSRSLRVRHEWR